jgi:hypothetical protein
MTTQLALAELRRKRKHIERAIRALERLQAAEQGTAHYEDEDLQDHSKVIEWPLRAVR